ncbi:MAG: Ig-like domain-containing protein [Spirochaetota bacterium]
MSTKRPHRSIATLAALAIAVFALSSCEDFFGTTDLKESIREEVVVATAEEMPVTVRPDPDVPGGTTSVASGTQKVGVPFEVSVTVLGEYAFTGWSEPSGTGAVSFADPSSKTTTATVNEVADGIVIQANFTRRPELESTDPFNYAENVFTNKTIRLYFSKPMDPSTVTSDTISITHRPFQTDDPPVSIEDRYQAPVPSSGNLVFTLELVAGEELSETHVVTLRVSRMATDADGHQMADDATLTFLVSNEPDDAPPVWDDTDAFTIRRPDGSMPGAGNAINTADLILRPRAFDNDIVLYLNVTEDDGSVPVDSQRLYQSEIDYTLQTAGQGSKTLRVTAEDASDNVTPDTQELTLIYDIEPPGLPDVTTLPATPTNAPVSFAVDATDVGLSGIDEYRLTGGATTTPTSGSGAFTGITPATEGANAITVVAVDNAGNISAVRDIGVFYDTTAPDQPTISIAPTTPASAPVSLSVNSTDPSPASGVVEYRITAGVQSVPLVSPTGSFTNVTPADQGDNTLRIVAIDDAGNTSAARTTTVFYDDEPPAVSGFAVGQNASTDTTTTSRNVRVWANVTDISTPVDAQFATNLGGPWTGFAPFTSGSTTFELPDTPASYTVYARFRDDLDNETISEISDTIDFDNLPPDQPTVTTPPASPTNAAVSFSVYADDNGPSGIDYYEITGGAPTAISNDGDFTGVVPATQGTNNITVVPVDNAGNVGPAVTVTVVYDTVPPAQPTIDTAPPSLTNSPVTIEVSSTDDRTGIAIYRIDSGVMGAPVENASGSFTNQTPANQGNNTIQIVAVDGAGNVSAAATATVTYDSVPPTQPTFVSAPTSPTDTDVSFAVTASDVTTSVSYYRLTGDAIGTPIEETDGSFTAITPSNEGNNTFTIVAVDEAGNASSALSTIVVYDTTDPDPPSIDVAPQSPTNSAVSLEVSSSDAGSGIDFYELAGDVDGAPLTSSTGTFSNVTPAIENATNTFSVVAVDNAGNRSSATTTDVVYDTDAPGAPGTPSKTSGSTSYINGGEATASISVDFAGTGAVENDRLILLEAAAGQIAERTLSSADASAGTYTFSVSSAAFGGDGSKTVTARVVDEAGNPGGESGGLALTKDTVPPTIAGTLSADASEITGFSVAEDGSGLASGGYSSTNGADFDGSILKTLNTLNDGESAQYTLGATDLAGNGATRTVEHSRSGSTYTAIFDP